MHVTCKRKKRLLYLQRVALGILTITAYHVLLGNSHDCPMCDLVSLFKDVCAKAIFSPFLDFILPHSPFLSRFTYIVPSYIPSRWRVPLDRMKYPFETKSLAFSIITTYCFCVTKDNTVLLFSPYMEVKCSGHCMIFLALLFFFIMQAISNSWSKITTHFIQIHKLVLTRCLRIGFEIWAK